MMPRRHCYWCGSFVPAMLAPKSWRVRVGKPARQNPRSAWNYWTRLVCDACLPADREVPFWRFVTAAEVQRRRQRGWPNTSPRGDA